MYKCEICGRECESQEELEVEHRGCRLKAAFPGAYNEQGDGLVTFDMKKVAKQLGLFEDIVVGRDGQPLHPLKGDLHFRITTDGCRRPEVWIELPVQVGNCLSSWTFCVAEADWIKLVKAVNLGLEEARRYLEQKKTLQA